MAGPTLYSDAGIAPRTDTHAAGKRMPYKSKAQAKAVLANTSKTNPKHAHARAAAKKKLRKPTGLLSGMKSR
ncbi:MAG: hypothetical protein F4Y04_07810 [Chloroflexi bacterium]|nr:hypothetical protein [Chloroflexota bacterium]